MIEIKLDNIGTVRISQQFIDDDLIALKNAFVMMPGLITSIIPVSVNEELFLVTIVALIGMFFLVHKGMYNNPFEKFYKKSYSPELLQSFLNEQYGLADLEVNKILMCDNSKGNIIDMYFTNEQNRLFLLRESHSAYIKTALDGINPDDIDEQLKENTRLYLIYEPTELQPIIENSGEKVRKIGERYL